MRLNKKIQYGPKQRVGIPMFRSSYDANNRPLYLASVQKPYTSDKDLTESEKEAILKKVEIDFHTAVKEARKILSDDMVFLVRRQGFFASIAVDMKKVIAMDVPIAAVNVINAISYLYINPLTYPALPRRERIGVLIHEILHISLFHIFRFQELPENEKFHYLWNLATDCIINQLVPNTSEIGLPPGVIYPETFEKYGIHMPKLLSADEYYQILLDNLDKLPPDMKSGMGDGDGQGQGSGEEQNGQGGKQQDGQGNSGASKGEGQESDKEGQAQSEEKSDYQNWHKKWAETKGSKKVNEAAVKNAVRRAYVREAGSLPGNMKRMIEKVIESKVPWHQKLSQLTAKYLRHSFISTYKRESRRLGDLAKGRRQKRKLSAVVIADTSASITEENLAQFTGHIMKIWKSGVKVTIIESDVQVTDVYEFTGKISRIKYAGNGGTSFIPPLEKIVEEKMEVDVVIYLTDGEGPAPDSYGIPTIWCLTPGGRKPYAVSGGEIKWGDFIEMN